MHDITPAAELLHGDAGYQGIAKASPGTHHPENALVLSTDPAGHNRDSNGAAPRQRKFKGGTTSFMLAM